MPFQVKMREQECKERLGQTCRLELPDYLSGFCERLSHTNASERTSFGNAIIIESFSTCFGAQRLRLGGSWVTLG